MTLQHSAEDIPVFPPLLTGHPVETGVVPLAFAAAGAREGRLGAGDVVWSRDRDKLVAAFVFEPDVPPARCREMIFLVMVAVVEALGVCLPPEVALTHRWPLRLLANGGEVGGLELLLSDEHDETGAPLWLVAGLTLNLVTDWSGREPGETPEKTALAEEGAPELDRSVVLQTISRHLLAWIHTWEHEGFEPVRQAWTFRAEGYGENIAVGHGEARVEGVMLGLDAVGNLLLKQHSPLNGTRVVMLDTALAERTFGDS